MPDRGIDEASMRPLLRTNEPLAECNDVEANKIQLSRDSIGKVLVLKAQMYATSFYIFVFFFAMIIHELALESVSTKFSELRSISSTVTLFQFGFCFVVPLIVSRGQVCETFPRSFKEVLPYFRLSILVFGATGLATESLRYVSYPTKVVFKSAKLIPTMIISTLVYRNKTYSPQDYIAALLICIGAAGYGFNPEKGSANDNTSYYGLILLTTSIICDAFVPNFQHKLMTTPITPDVPRTNGKSTSNALSAQAVMVNTNAVGFFMLSIYMFFCGSLKEAISTASRDIELLKYLVGIGLGLATAVFFYTKLIKNSGSVTAVAVTTLRKVVTMVLSYIFFPKPIMTQHVISGLLVLSGILINIFHKKR